MQFQVALYAIAAKKEMEYQPDQGMVRYLDAGDKADSELTVPLNADALKRVKSSVAKTAGQIRDRSFRIGPAKSKGAEHRCGTCDFIGICGMKEALDFKKSKPREW